MTPPQQALLATPATDWTGHSYFERIAAANALLYTFGLIPEIQFHRIDLRLREAFAARRDASKESANG